MRRCCAKQNDRGSKYFEIKRPGGQKLGGGSFNFVTPAAVALLRAGWLNVRSPVLLDLYFRFFCILDVCTSLIDTTVKPP